MQESMEDAISWCDHRRTAISSLQFGESQARKIKV